MRNAVDRWRSMNEAAASPQLAAASGQSTGSTGSAK